MDKPDSSIEEWAGKSFLNWNLFWWSMIFASVWGALGWIGLFSIILGKWR